VALQRVGLHHRLGGGNGGAIIQRLLAPQLPETSQFILMTSLSFAGTILGSLLTAPTPRPVLENFYRTTRPFGLWGPLRDVFRGADRAAVDRESRNDLMAVPFALLWQVTMFLLPMQLVIKAYDSFLTTLPLFLLGTAGLYWFWLAPASGPGTRFLNSAVTSPTRLSCTGSANRRQDRSAPKLKSARIAFR
jgi:hypothetical protein